MPVSVGEFFEEGKAPLSMDIQAGEAYLDNTIKEEALNRPGLALTGFFQYFAHKRIQVFGLAELTYLKSLKKQERVDVLTTFFDHNIPCVALTRNRYGPKELVDLAEEYKVPVLRSPMITSRFINAATVIMERLVAPQVRLHGTMVDILGVGVLIEGDAGIGKSETALALVEKGHSLVADDVVILRKDGSGAIIASPAEITRYHMEIRGLGIIHVPSLFGVASIRSSMRLDLIVRLHAPGKGIENDRTGLDQDQREILGDPINVISLPVHPGRSVANVVEVAALNQKLKKLGHDAAKELDERVLNLLAKKGDMV